MSPTQGRKIALVGASGNIGTHTLSALVSQGIHTLTVIQREESTATYPSSVTVKKGDLSDSSFLEAALAGQDVLVLQLSRFAMDSQPGLVRAAAAARVPYVLPVEFGSDPSAKLFNDFPMLREKNTARELIAELGVSSWIAVVTNPWLDYGLQQKAWGFNVQGRKASLWGGGNTKVNTGSVKRAGEATAAMLALPEDELAKYRNKPFFMGSLYVTQREIFESILRVTKTEEKDWEVKTPDMDQVAKESDEAMMKGDMAAFMTKFFMMHFREGMGGDFNSKVDSGRLELPQEDLDKVIEEGLKSAASA